MAKMDLPEPTSKCPVCGINQYPPDDKPVIWPCGIGTGREKNLKPADRQKCPYETDEDREKLMEMQDHEKIAGLLGTQHTNELG